MSDQHALDYYAAPERETATNAGPVQNWSIPADNFSGPTSAFGFGSSVGTNAVDMAGLNAAEPSDVANSGSGPIPSGVGVIPTL